MTQPQGTFWNPKYPEELPPPPQQSPASLHLTSTSDVRTFRAAGHSLKLYECRGEVSLGNLAWTYFQQERLLTFAPLVLNPARSWMDCSSREGAMYEWRGNIFGGVDFKILRSSENFLYYPLISTKADFQMTKLNMLFLQTIPNASINKMQKWAGALVDSMKYQVQVWWFTVPAVPQSSGSEPVGPAGAFCVRRGLSGSGTS